MVLGGPERGSGCPSDSKESLQDRGFYVFCCHANLVVVLDVVASNPIAHPIETALSSGYAARSLMARRATGLRVGQNAAIRVRREAL